ncbi:MAG: type II toxin-antitoxin system RelE/ParE family toxin [Desulfobacca sp.]|nr:type II toxin-antitoxin system RelE/ParE family toxin [Desulfobacca sp.]
MTERIKSAWQVEIHDRFYKKLAKIPRPERQNLLVALKKLQNDPFALDLKPLRGRTDWRLRIGAWRILLRLDMTEKVIVIYEIGGRGNIYRR